LSLNNKKPPKSGGFLLLVWFAAFPAGSLVLHEQRRCLTAKEYSLLRNFVSSKKRVIIFRLAYYRHRPFPPSRKRALALGKDVPWP
ncbi:TPA: hypothetical protein ACNTCT_003913, partial [Escherichia coli]